ncbi:hypothetical protein CALCODRAFT_510985 [Calocera cornea HHB12733]|uniref:Uncharacterized protein n=1 Tax=Calocera cornea HHB12733 TaxID=1353952 RepID=A0A165E4F8_9BASI|nr:hypothetical protein CALCODRAFT_510985 [Calocera cornea HHB12733]
MPVDGSNLVNGLYLALCWREEGFHWMIYTFGPGHARWAFHAITISNGWMYHMQNWNPVASHLALAAIQIGQFVEPGTLDVLLGAIPLQTHPDDQPHNFTCRMWVRRAIRVLHQAGYINCTNLNALEAEAADYAETHREGVAFLGELGQVYRSQFCS